jgi:hypothetical protein
MPIPKPKKGEKKNDFISRCMGDDVMKGDYSDQDQRLGVCYSSWEDVHGKERNSVSADELRSGGLGIQSSRIDLVAENVRMVDKNSQFYGMFQPDEHSAFVEFDICHSLPVIAGPAYHTRNYTCWHPASLCKSHRGLLYKQTNLHHMIKSYDPEEIPRDRIIGAVVMTSYPQMPEGGWVIPENKEDAIPIRACAAIFKQAEGALEMLNDHKSGRQKWSVSIEMAGKSVDQMGIYFPGQRKIVPLIEVPDDVMMEAVSKDDCGCLCVGKHRGEQLALCYGGTGGEIIFRGVGFTPTPAEKEARIRGVELSTEKPVYEVEEKPGGIMAMCASSANVALGTAAIPMVYKGARLVQVWTAGKPRLQDHVWSLDASPSNPVVEILLSTGKPILKYLNEVVAAVK